MLQTTKIEQNSHKTVGYMRINSKKNDTTSYNRRGFVPDKSEKEAFIHTAKMNASKIFSKHL